MTDIEHKASHRSRSITLATAINAWRELSNANSDGVSKHFVDLRDYLGELIFRGKVRAGFPVGYYNGNPHVAELYGVDVHLLYTNHWPEWTPEQVTNCKDNLKLLADKGFHAILQVIRVDYDPARVERMINGLVKEDTIVAWYLYDEPELVTDTRPGLSAGQAIKAYDQIKLLDPSRPVCLNFTPDTTIDLEYRHAMDVYMPDPYPICGEHAEFHGPKLAGYYRTLCSLKDFADNKLGKPFWPVMQGHKRGVWQCAQFRFPSFHEARYMTYAAVQAGAQGMFFFSDTGPTEQTLELGWAIEKLSVITSEFNRNLDSFALGPIGALSVQCLAIHNPAPTEDNPDPNPTVATIYLDANFVGQRRYVLLLVHHANSSVKVRVRIDDPVIRSSIGLDTLLYSTENPLPPLMGNAFEVSLNPYEVCIYKFGIKS